MKKIYFPILCSLFLFINSLELEAGKKRYRKNHSAWSSCQILKAAGGLALGAWTVLEIYTYGPGFSFSWETQRELAWEGSEEKLLRLLERAREKQENNSLRLDFLLGFGSYSILEEKRDPLLTSSQQQELPFLDPHWENRTYSLEESSQPPSACWKVDPINYSVVACSTP